MGNADSKHDSNVITSYPSLDDADESSKSSRSAGSAGSDEQGHCDSANFKWMNDRKFADTIYFLPSDNKELERCRARHRVYATLFAGRVLAPLEIKLKSNQPCEFLEIGCGLGDWCVNVASDYPNVNVLGIDHYNTFQGTEYPKNCRFDIIDASKWPMPLEGNKFDLIHIEVFGLVLPTSQYEEFLAEIYRLLKPGGYIQWIEPDLEVWNAGPEGKKIDKAVQKILRLRSLDPHLPRRIDRLVKAGGFINIKHTFVSFPFGNWGEGTLIEATNKLITDSYDSVAPVICNTYGLSTEQYNAKKETAIEEMKVYKAHLNMHLIVAGKPLPV